MMAGSVLRAGLAMLVAASVAGCMNAIPQPAAAPPPRRTSQHATPPRQSTQRTPPARLAAPPPAPFRAPQVEQVPGVEGLIGQNAGSLVRQLGTPRLDVHEGDMRKLQFTGQACVLDVFLYPLQQGAEPVATYVEARRESDGQDVDKASCVQALLRR